MGEGVPEGVGRTKGAKPGSVTTLPATTAIGSDAGGTPADASNCAGATLPRKQEGI